MSTRAKSRGKKKQKTSKVGERAPSPVPPPPQPPRSPSPPPEDLPGADEVPGPSQPRDDKAEKKKEKRPRKSFTLKPDQEDNAFEWLAENELLWRRGSRMFKDTNRKKALWEEKATELEITSEHLQGWWRGMHTWYVKLHRVKSGQAPKKLTDRERYVLQKCAFYEGELRHRGSAPIKSLSRVVNLDAAGDAASEAGSVESSLTIDVMEVDREEGEEEPEDQLSNLEKDAAKACKDAVHNKAVIGRSSKRKRQDDEEEECLKEIRESMKSNSQLLSQLVADKPSSPRDPFIAYVSDTLRTLPDYQYESVMRKVTSILQNPNAFDSADHHFNQPAIPRPGQYRYTPPHDLYQPHSQYHQHQRPAYTQYQPTHFQQPHQTSHDHQSQQFQQPQPSTIPREPRDQPSQLEHPSTSRAIEEPRRSGDSLTQMLKLSNDVLNGSSDGSLNLSLSGLGDDSLSSMKSLNTPPVTITSPSRSPKASQ